MGSGNREPLDCPLCAFTTNKDYDLLLHVELSHPDPDNLRPSPFVVREGAHAGSRNDTIEEVEGAKDKMLDNSPPEVAEDEYIECQCGEYCLLAEFESHLEMHYAEGMSFDDSQKSTLDPVVQKSTLYHGKASSPGMQSPPLSPIEDAVPASSSVAPIKSTASRRSHSAGRKSHSLVQDFIDVLRHSTAPPPRKPSRTEFRRVPQRLGVSIAHAAEMEQCLNV